MCVKFIEYLLCIIECLLWNGVTEKVEYLSVNFRSYGILGKLKKYVYFLRLGVSRIGCVTFLSEFYI